MLLTRLLLDTNGCYFVLRRAEGNKPIAWCLLNLNGSADRSLMAANELACPGAAADYKQTERAAS